MVRLNKSKFVFVRFLSFLFLCLGGGWLMGLFTQHGVDAWYPQLIKPWGTPPALVFPIFWTLLYTAMAVSLTLLTVSKKSNKTTAYVLFGIQLFLNFIWSFLFFYLESPMLALGDLILLIPSVFLTIVSFWRHTKLGAYLLIPYLIWILYALYLNGSIAIQN